jgi:hypothetical protein
MIENVLAKDINGLEFLSGCPRLAELCFV